jgi:hypothetical protein
MHVRAALLVLLLPLIALVDEPSWGEATKLCDLADRDIKEASGLAVSRTLDGVLWTHNDSGDAPRLFAIDRAGATRATFTLEGAEAVDWEDLCSFRRGERGWVLVADTGDNDSLRASVMLYLVEEPRSLPPGPATVAARAISVTYEDGRHDCESIGVDATSGTVLLVTKMRQGGKPSAYSFPLDGDGAKVARRIAELDMPSLATAMDVSPDGRLAVALTYGDAYLWTRGEREEWGVALSRTPRQLPMPARRQGEAICFDTDGRSLLLTSEKLPAPLLSIPALTGR